MNNKLTIKNLSKTIHRNLILDNINVAFESKHIYGIVGENGSGKSMLLRHIAGLVLPSKGQIEYNNSQLHKDISCVPNLGLLIENLGLYPEFSGLKNLQYLANIKKKIDTKQIVNSIERVGLNPYDKRPYKKYSLGMKQRILIAQAIMEQPDILLLDEFSNSLDNDGVRLVRDIILEECARGVMVIFTSHIYQDIELLADTVHYINNGVLS
jgi:ABC-2 type transport system ATP-binding protein